MAYAHGAKGATITNCGQATCCPLHASASELLEALKAMVSGMDATLDAVRAAFSVELESARAAIRKAEGQL